MEKRNNINGLGNPHYNRSLAGLTKKLWIKGEPVGKINRIIEKRLTNVAPSVWPGRLFHQPLQP